MADEGFKRKLAAILSAIDDKVPCILEPELTDKAFRPNWARLIQKITASLDQLPMPPGSQISYAQNPNISACLKENAFLTIRPVSGIWVQIVGCRCIVAV